MRKFYALIPLLLLAFAGRLRAESGAVTISTSKRVAVSISTATSLLTADPQAKKTCLLNATTDYLLIGDEDTTFSTSATTGTFRLPGTVANTNPCWYCFDGPGAPYKGVLKAMAPGASAAVNVDVIRER